MGSRTSRPSTTMDRFGSTCRTTAAVSKRRASSPARRRPEATPRPPRATSRLTAPPTSPTPRAAAPAATADADVGGTSGGAWVFRQLTGSARLATSVDAAASASTVAYNGGIDITGTFHSPGGGCLRDDTVSLHRSGPNGTFDLGPTEVAGDGTFGFEDVPPSAGAYDYQVVFAGDATHATSSSVTMHVDVTKIPTSLSLAASRGVVTYGSSTTLSATLEGGAATSSVAFERHTADGWKQIATDQIGGDHVARLD